MYRSKYILYSLYIPSKIQFLFKKPETERDAIIRKNVVGSLVFQFFTNVLGLLIVPLSLSYIDKEKYGIWINASVMVTWLQNMNFGMGFGMQNKVAEAVAKGETELAREYVTITYKFSTIIASALLVLGIIGGFFLDWHRLFNSSISSSELSSIALIAFVCFLAYFVLGNIVPLLNATKQTQVPKLFGLITNIITVIFLFSIGKFSHNNLTLAALALALPTPLIYLVGNLFYFKKPFRHLQPGWKIRDRRHVKDVFALGVKFFIMQLTTLAINQSGIFIITQYISPEEVTPFSIVSRYFYFGFFIFSLAITPYWSGFTEAYVKQDFAWIRKALRQLFVVSTIGATLILVMLPISFWLIPFWTKNAVNASAYPLLVYSGAFYIILTFYTSVIAIFLNGVNVLNYQLIVQVALAILCVASSVLLISHYGFGSAAINMSLILTQVIYLVLCGRKAFLFLKNAELRNN